jgi:hypothetical protein
VEQICQAFRQGVVRKKMEELQKLSLQATQETPTRSILVLAAKMTASGNAEYTIKPEATTPAIDTSDWPLLLRNYNNRERKSSLHGMIESKP